MIRNTASQTISASLVSRTDGSAVTSGTTTVYVTKDGGTQATGSGTVTHEGNGEWSYVPTQSETDAVHVAFTFTNSTAVQATVNVYTRPAGTGFPAVDASNRVDVGEVMGIVLSLSGNVVTFPFGVLLQPTTTSTVALNIRGGEAATGVWIRGGNYNATPDVTGSGLVIATGTDSGNNGVHRSIILTKGATPTEGVSVTGNINAVLDTVTTATTATNLTNLPTIPSNWLTAAGIAAGALDGKGNWNIGKTGYALTATTGLGNQTANITGTITTATNVTTVNGLAANVITAASIAADAITDAKVASDVTIASVTGAVGSVTGNVGGNVTGSVGSISGITFPTNFASLGINASGHISRVTLVDNSTAAPDSAGTTTLLTRLTSTRAGYLDNIATAAPTSAQNAAALLDLTDGIETNITPRGAFRLILAASAGKLSGAATSTVTIRNVGDTKNRLVASVDADGNRSAVTTDAT
jgi:hypothetical protein